MEADHVLEVYQEESVMIQGSRFRVQGSGFRVQGSAFKVLGSELLVRRANGTLNLER
jgi:hypothetical protein